MRLIRTVNNERSGSNEIVAILKSDVALTAEVLRRANSPLFGLAAKVTSASQAVMLLGTDEIRRLAMSISLARHFSGENRTMWRLWRHAFARALVAERIARVTGLGTETAYSAGLLADIGMYGLMVSFFAEEQRVLDLAVTPDAMLAGEEREFGVNHCQAGEWLARQWGLPESIINAVARHHEAPDTSTIAGTVYWADCTTSCLGFGFRGTASQPRLDITAYRELRERAGAPSMALPDEAKELSGWLAARVPA
jgi:HD-like signal output (HDOD) protein